MNIEKFKVFFQIAPIRTILFNLKYFPLKEAFRFPVFLAHGVSIVHCYKGFCEFEGGVRTGMLKFGFLGRDSNPNVKCRIMIRGKVIVQGCGFHSFGVGTILIVGEKGVLTLGNNFSAAGLDKIVCKCAITVGDDNMWSWGNVIMDSDIHQICNDNNQVINYNKEIVFGNHVWLGCNNIVLKGAIIPDGCIIASGSKISGKFTEKNTIITSQGKVIKTNVFWKRDGALNIDK